MYVRVDLFIINSEVVFGEFTNYPRSAQPQAPQWEKLGGEKWREARGAPKIEERIMKTALACFGFGRPEFYQRMLKSVGNCNEIINQEIDVFHFSMVEKGQCSKI